LAEPVAREERGATGSLSGMWKTSRHFGTDCTGRKGKRATDIQGETAGAICPGGITQSLASDEGFGWRGVGSPDLSMDFGVFDKMMESGKFVLFTPDVSEPTRCRPGKVICRTKRSYNLHSRHVHRRVFQ